MWTCPGCDEPNDDEGLWCVKCGNIKPESDPPMSAPESSAPPQVKLCPHCQQSIPFSALKCRFCRKYVDDQDVPGRPGAGEATEDKGERGMPWYMIILLIIGALVLAGVGLLVFLMWLISHGMK